MMLAFTAQAQTRTDNLYINPTILVSSARLTALAGASVALAEGVEGMATNYAAVAQKDPRRTKRYDWDATFGLLSTPVEGFQDLENDPSTKTGTQPYTSVVEGQAGLTLQLLKFGIGGFGRISNRTLCLDRFCSEVLTSATMHGGLVAGAALFQDQLVVAAGFNVTQAELKTLTEDVVYTGSSFGVAALLRMHHQPFRLGAQFLLGHTGMPANPTPIAGRLPFLGITTPHKVTLGGSLRLGPGSERYNRVSQALVDEQPKYAGAPELPHDTLHDVPPGPWLLTAQLDLVLPVTNATTVRSFLFGGEPTPAGDAFFVVPRLGVEHELLPKLLRVRTGAWLEPNLVQGSSVRTHATFGFELFAFHLWDDWSISAALDAAPRYLSGSIGIGYWR